MKNTRIFRISFYNQGDVYELYARKVHQSDMYAFVEIEDIIFGERTSVVVDPSEERLKTEFAGVTSTHIPLQAVIRIDEVEREGTNKIITSGDNKAKVTHFPLPASPAGNRSDPK